MIEIQDIALNIIIIVIGILGLAAFGITSGLFYKGIDRKLSAHMQGRIGPPIRQPFRDIVKLFTKENIVPENAIPWIFNLIPMIGLVGAISILLYIPIGGFQPLLNSVFTMNGTELSLYYGDLILILYLLMIPSLAMVIGGFASGSPYATIGAQREMTTMIAYEFPLAIIIMGFAYRFSRPDILGQINNQNVFALSTIASTPIWNYIGIFGFIGFGLLLFVLVIVTPAELSKIPFDSPEAETELAGGLLAEYSGRNLAMFYLTDGVKTVVMASIVVALFFPYNLSNLIGLESYPAYAIDIIFYLVKVLIVIVLSVSLIRVATARLKIDQIVYIYWIPLTLIALIGLIFIMWDWTALTPASQDGLGWSTVAEMLGL